MDRDESRQLIRDQIVCWVRSVAGGSPSWPADWTSALTSSCGAAWRAGCPASRSCGRADMIGALVEAEVVDPEVKRTGARLKLDAPQLCHVEWSDAA